MNIKTYLERRRNVKAYLTGCRCIDVFTDSVDCFPLRRAYILAVHDHSPKYMRSVIAATVTKEELPDGRERLYFRYPKLREIFKKIKEDEKNDNYSF